MSEAVKETFCGRAFLSVMQSNSEYANGMRGACSVVVVRASDIVVATDLIYTEFEENALSLRGFDYLFDVNFMDRLPSDYENHLIARLGTYPVQFKNVHYFPADA